MPEYYISKTVRSSIIYDSERKQLICKTCSMQRRIKEIGGEMMDLPVWYRKEHLCEKCEHNKCRYIVLTGPEEVLICNECLSNYLGYN